MDYIMINKDYIVLFTKVNVPLEVIYTMFLISRLDPIKKVIIRSSL